MANHGRTRPTATHAADTIRDRIEEADRRILYGFTPAEATLAHLLAEGLSLAEAAASLRLRRETTRSRVKSIFEKTNTHSQAELERLLLVARVAR